MAFTQGKTYVMYISMDNDKDFDHWMKLATVSGHKYITCTTVHVANKPYS